MTATETIERIDEALKDAATGLDILEHLEFDIELPCEHVGHGQPGRFWHTGPGEVLVTSLPAECECGFTPRHNTLLLCRSAWDHAGKHGLACPRCKACHPRHEWWVLVGTTR